MTRRAVPVLLAFLALTACRKEPPAAPTPQPAPTANAPAPPGEIDTDNLLNLAYGTAVAFRGGELNLESSAVHAIDGFSNTFWISAPGTPEETFVFSLLAPAQIRRVGVSAQQSGERMESVAFQTSMDGKSWRDLATIRLEGTDARQFATVTPTVARYLRVHTFDPTGQYYVRARGFHASGEEMEPPATPSFSGCWMLNGVRARIEQKGARITGVLETSPPTFLDGGTDNRVAMVMWMRESAWGYAALTRTPDGQRMSGLMFYEHINPRYVGEGLLGPRCAPEEAFNPPPPANPGRFLQRAKIYSLYGLAFDAEDRLIEEVSAPLLDSLVSILESSPSQRYRVVAHELRADTPAQNQQHTAARLQALRAALGKRGVTLDRIDFVSAGSDWDGPPIGSVLQRSLVSRVDLETGT